MPLSDYLKGPKHRARSEQLETELSALKERHTSLQALATKFGAMEVDQVQQEVASEKERLQAVKFAVRQAQEEAATVAGEVKRLRDQLLVLEESLLLETFALYVPKFKLTSTTEYKLRLDDIRARQKDMVKAGTAATGNMNWEVNGRKSEGRKLVNDMIKLVVRSFNNECDFCVDNVKFDNVELGEKRIRKSFETCNKLGRVMSVELSPRYLETKLDELRLAHEFQIKRQEEKEEAKRIREELREQQKLEQEIRAAREKIAKERKHFAAALKDLHARFDQASSDEERAALRSKIAEVEASKVALDGEERLIDYREGNAKAGYVYVISNIGAFGEGVYKIGMTRRLDPMERVDELGDASVPFWFDVHAMVFSDNAPALEAKLHVRFAAGRLNKVNGRKEFFRANIVEIEAVIREHYDPVVEVVREAAAEQYRESLRMAMPLPTIQQAEDAAASSAGPAAPTAPPAADPRSRAQGASSQAVGAVQVNASVSDLNERSSDTPLEQDSQQPPAHILAKIRAVQRQAFPDDRSTQKSVVEDEVNAYLQLQSLRGEGIPDDVFQGILERLRSDHPDDYGTQLFSVNGEIEAWGELATFKPEGVPGDILETICARSREDHADYSTQLFSIKESVEAWRELRALSHDGVPGDVFALIFEQARTDFADDYGTQLFSVKEGIAEWRELLASHPGGVPGDVVRDVMQKARGEHPNELEFQLAMVKEEVGAYVARQAYDAAR